MNKADVQDATPIVLRLTQHLAAIIPGGSGQAGSIARTALGNVAANAGALLSTDALGIPLTNCFAAVRAAGATQAQFEQVRAYTDAEQPKRLGGVLVQNSGIYLCLATEAQIIAATTYVSRQDVNAVKAQLRTPFDDAEEIAADDMDQASFAALVALDAAITNFLSATARPLPQLVAYQFAAILPSLVIAYRLYADAGRADELVRENKIVHPAFCPPLGIALSA